MKDRHAQKEIEIFRSFVAASGLDIDVSSIEKREPPEPDILCCIDGNKVAFELVELIDDKLACRSNNQVRLMEQFRCAYEACSADERVAIDRSVGDALIYVTFRDNVSFKASVA